MLVLSIATVEIPPGPVGVPEIVAVPNPGSLKDKPAGSEPSRLYLAVAIPLEVISKVLLVPS